MQALVINSETIKTALAGKEMCPKIIRNDFPELSLGKLFYGKICLRLSVDLSKSENQTAGEAELE